MLDRFFRLSENHTNVRTELLAGLTTFLTMAYIIVVQPMVLSGKMAGQDTGMDFGAVTTATCIAAALASAIMGLYGRYPIAQAPGMGENFFFVSLVAGSTAAMSWQTGLGVVFYSGVIFLLLSMLGVREKLMEAISPSMRNGIAVGIGLFIVVIGMNTTHLLLANKQDGGWRLNPHFASPDLIVFFFGLLVTAALHARRVRGSIILGIAAATALAAGLKLGLPLLGERMAGLPLLKDSLLMSQFAFTKGVVALPPSIAPTLLKLDLLSPLSWAMAPFILIFLVHGAVRHPRHADRRGRAGRPGPRQPLAPRRQALMSDAVGTVAGAVLGTSTVTSFIESASGVEQGGRTGLTALVAAALFLLALSSVRSST